MKIYLLKLQRLPTETHQGLAQLSNNSANADAVEPEELEDVIPDEVLRLLSENEVDRRRFVFILPFFSSMELRFSG